LPREAEIWRAYYSKAEVDHESGLPEAHVASRYDDSRGPLKFDASSQYYDPMVYALEDDVGWQIVVGVKRTDIESYGMNVEGFEVTKGSYYFSAKFNFWQFGFSDQEIRGFQVFDTGDGIFSNSSTTSPLRINTKSSGNFIPRITNPLVLAWSNTNSIPHSSHIDSLSESPRYRE